MADNQYEREIDELLRRLDAEHRGPLPFRARRSRRPWTAAWQRLTGGAGPRATTERLVLLAAVVLLATFLLSRVVPASVIQPLSWGAGMLALAAFVGALALSVVTGTTRTGQTPDYGRPYGGYAGRSIDWNRVSWRLRGWWRRFRR